MIRQHEKDVVWQAGAFTALVHALLLALFLVSFQWKTVQPMNVAQVELWDSVPSPKVDPTPLPPPEPTPTPETRPSWTPNAANAPASAARKDTAGADLNPELPDQAGDRSRSTH